MSEIEVASGPSIVIVNYHKARRLALGLEALRSQADFHGQIVVVDNSVHAEEEATLREACERFDASLIVAPINLGYSRGVNCAAEHLTPGADVILMSPDILVLDKSVIPTMRALLAKDGRVGIVAPTQANDDGSEPEISREFPTPFVQLLRRVRARKSPEEQLESRRISPDGDVVDWVQSSFCLIRRDLWDETGGLDEAYEIFMADTQLGINAVRLGYSVVVFRDSGVRADGVRASGERLFAELKKRTFRIHCKDALKYYLKNGITAPRRSQRTAVARRPIEISVSDGIETPSPERSGQL